MSLLWREQLSVGNNVIDVDHKYLIEIINSVEGCLKARRPADLAKALDNLEQYSRLHFVREELIASAAGYTLTPHLNESHQALLAQLDHIRGEIDAMGHEWSTETVDHFVRFLHDWLINHVIKEDLLMKPVLQKHSPSFDPR